MAKGFVPRTDAEKSFIKAFDELCYRHNPWTVWRDFVTVTATSIANAVDFNQAREDNYLAVVKGYTREEIDRFVEMSADVILAFADNPGQDFLGRLYQGLNFGSDWHGQFFTPWHVAKMMSKMTFHPAELESKDFMSVCDPACGSGVMLLATASVCQDCDPPINYQERVLFVGQDLDPVVAMMCYIQISLIGCAGYVAIGNSLTHPIAGPVLLPESSPDCDVWFTPGWFSPIWQMRRVFAKVGRDFGIPGGTA